MASRAPLLCENLKSYRKNERCKTWNKRKGTRRRRSKKIIKRTRK
jgi:hypothetical protein